MSYFDKVASQEKVDIEGNPLLMVENKVQPTRDSIHSSLQSFDRNLLPKVQDEVSKLVNKKRSAEISSY